MTTEQMDYADAQRRLGRLRRRQRAVGCLLVSVCLLLGAVIALAAEHLSIAISTR